jgi:hypothetical protein
MHLFTHPSINFTDPSIRPSIDPSIHSSIHPSVRPLPSVTHPEEATFSRPTSPGSLGIKRRRGTSDQVGIKCVT